MGDLEYIEDWDEDLAAALAEEEGLVLREEHLVILKAARAFYEENMIDPTIRDLAKKTGMEKTAINALFPGGAKQIAAIAGIEYTGCV
jgi:tRNA 2-thiouridine synthesizing protein E